MVTNTDSCVPHPNQYAALCALSESQDSVALMRDEFKRRRDHIVDGLNESVELTRRLLHEAGVAVLADAHFGTPIASEGQHLRFSYACSIDQIDAGPGRIRNYVESD